MQALRKPRCYQTGFLASISVHTYSGMCDHKLMSHGADLWLCPQDVSRHSRSTFAMPETGIDPVAALTTAWGELGHNEREDSDRSIFRVHSKDSVIVWITPLVLPVITQLLSDLGHNVRD